MEYVDGRTLHQLVVDDGRRFTPREIASIGHALCSAVAAVHAAGLLHRDIKAQNVMMARDGRVVLMDFGSGRDRGGPAAVDLAGTPLYLAPEVLAGTSSPSVQSDIYSIGVLLFFLLTGSYPVTGADLAALCKAHEHGERRALKALAPKVPRGLVRSIERAIHPRAERRHQSADELANDLSSVGRRWGRMALPYAAAAAAAIAAAAIAIISWQVVTDRQRASTGVPAKPPAIAVLPFENLSKEADSEHFADGLTYEIHRYLAGIEGLELRSATSSFAFKSKPRDLADVAKQLDVDYVLEGTILKSGTKLRVSPRLTQVAGDTTIWTNTYDREIREVFATLDEMSLAIVNSLRLKLGRGQRRYETDPELYAQFLNAHGLRSRGHPDNSRKAAELFEAIVAKDPSFAPAWAGLASAAADATRWGRGGPAAHRSAGGAGRAESDPDRSAAGGSPCSNRQRLCRQSRLDERREIFSPVFGPESESDDDLLGFHSLDASPDGEDCVGLAAGRDGSAHRPVVSRCAAVPRGAAVGCGAL